MDDNIGSARLGLRPREQRAWLSGRWDGPALAQQRTVPGVYRAVHNEKQRTVRYANT